MRLLLTFRPLQDFPYTSVNKHTVQGFLYSLLLGTSFREIHESNKFKFFAFSDIFPSGDFETTHDKTLIVSSPDRNIIYALANSIQSVAHSKLGGLDIEVRRVKVFDLEVSRGFITGSPIVLYQDGQTNRYISFQKNPDVGFFLQRLRDNAIRKYEVFVSKEAFVGEPLFDKLQFKKEVAVRVSKGDRRFLIIGSMWSLLEKINISQEEYPFYKFIMDCGLGEKNSLGFGFLNPVR